MAAPFVGWGLMAIRAIAIDRSSGSSAREQIVEQGAQRLKEGHWVTIFPEGTRTAPGKGRPLMASAARFSPRAPARPSFPSRTTRGEYWAALRLQEEAGHREGRDRPPHRDQGARDVSRSTTTCRTGSRARCARSAAALCRRVSWSRATCAASRWGRRASTTMSCRRGRRGVGLVGSTRPGLTVNAPSTMAVARIEALLRESERWVLRKTAARGARACVCAGRMGVDGAGLPYPETGPFVLRLAAGKRNRAVRCRRRAARQFAGDGARTRGAARGDPVVQGRGAGAPRGTRRTPFAGRGELTRLPGSCRARSKRAGGAATRAARCASPGGW